MVTARSADQNNLFSIEVCAVPKTALVCWGFMCPNNGWIIRTYAKAIMGILANNLLPLTRALARPTADRWGALLGLPLRCIILPAGDDANLRRTKGASARQTTEQIARTAMR